MDWLINGLMECIALYRSPDGGRWRRSLLCSAPAVDHPRWRHHWDWGWGVDGDGYDYYWFWSWLIMKMTKMTEECWRIHFPGAVCHHRCGGDGEGGGGPPGQDLKFKSISNFKIRTFFALLPKRSSWGFLPRNRFHFERVCLETKLQVSKLVKEKNICASEIMADLNRQVRKWGLDVRYLGKISIIFSSASRRQQRSWISPFGFRCVSLSEAKVLKKPEGNNGIAPLLQVTSL